MKKTTTKKVTKKKAAKKPAKKKAAAAPRKSKAKKPVAIVAPEIMPFNAPEKLGIFAQARKDWQNADTKGKVKIAAIYLLSAAIGGSIGIFTARAIFG